MATHVELMKLIIAYTLVGAFVFTVAITCLSLIGLIKFADRKQQAKLFSVLIVELVVLGLGTFANLLELSPRQATENIQAPLKKEVAVQRQEVATQRQATDVVTQKLESTALEGLQPEARSAARQLIQAAKAEGIEVGIISGYRSPVDQLKLYARGRTAPGPRVTSARVSVHSTGLAFDVAIFRNGKPVFDDVPAYQRLGALSKQSGLVWGGDWTAFRDYPHFETPGAKAAAKALERSLGFGAVPAEDPTHDGEG